MTIRSLLLTTAAAVLVSTAPAFAQQPAPERQQSEDVPTFTNDDVAPPVVVTPTEETEEAIVDDPSMTAEERADATAGDATGQAGAKGKGKKGSNQAEQAWQQRLIASKARVQSAERAAQQAEIRITELRNQLSQSAENRDAILAEIDQQNQAVENAKAAVVQAKMELSRVEAEGREKKYSPAAGPSKTTKGGAPNSAYYLAKFREARTEFEDANRQVKLYQYRVNDLRTRANNNSGSGDEFTQMPLTQELNEALADLEKAQAAQAAASSRVETARRQALAAGVLPGQLR